MVMNSPVVQRLERYVGGWWWVGGDHVAVHMRPPSSSEPSDGARMRAEGGHTETEAKRELEVWGEREKGNEEAWDSGRLR